MQAGSVTLNDGPLQALCRGLAEAEGAYIKVGVLGAYAARNRGETGNKRWLSTARWSKGLKVRDAKGKVQQIGAGYLTNAQIGAIHEFGSPEGHIPERSFLRMPILTRLSGELKKIPEQNFRDVFLDGTGAGSVGGLIAVLRVVGKAAVNVVNDAFNTGGFGQWRKLAKSTIARKGNAEILIESEQLRRSITFAVVTVGSRG